MKDPEREHDRVLPDDFDPNALFDDAGEVKAPGEGGYKRHKRKRAQHDEPNDVQDLLPMLHALPAPLRRLLFTGSCCAGVAVLYVLSAWDHGWIPGFNSQFASAADMRQADERIVQMLELQIAAAIRELSKANCVAETPALTDQIESLQSKYRAITGERYPHRDCLRM